MSTATAVRKKIRLSAGEKAFYITAYAIVTLLALIVLYPLIYIVSASFSSAAAVSTGKVILWPVEFSVEGYKRVFMDDSIWSAYGNTIFYTVVGTFINVAMTLICAYPLARPGLPHKKFFTFLFSFTMMFGGGMIPSYLLMRDLHILNSFWVMVIPGAMAVYQMVIVRTFFQTNLPGELIEATQVDGCNDIRFFFQFALPLSKAVIAVIPLQYAIGHWNDYFWPFIMTSSKEVYPLTIGIAALRDAEGAYEWDFIMAGNTILVAPILLVYAIFHKRIVRAFAYSGIK